MVVGHQRRCRLVVPCLLLPLAFSVVCSLVLLLLLLMLWGMGEVDGVDERGVDVVLSPRVGRVVVLDTSILHHVHVDVHVHIHLLLDGYLDLYRYSYGLDRDVVYGCWGGDGRRFCRTHADGCCCCARGRVGRAQLVVGHGECRYLTDEGSEVTQGEAVAGVEGKETFEYVVGLVGDGENGA